MAKYRSDNLDWRTHHRDPWNRELDTLIDIKCSEPYYKSHKNTHSHIWIVGIGSATAMCTLANNDFGTFLSWIHLGERQAHLFHERFVFLHISNVIWSCLPWLWRTSTLCARVSLCECVTYAFWMFSFPACLSHSCCAFSPSSRIWSAFLHHSNAIRTLNTIPTISKHTATTEVPLINYVATTGKLIYILYVCIRLHYRDCEQWAQFESSTLCSNQCRVPSSTYERVAPAFVTIAYFLFSPFSALRTHLIRFGAHGTPDKKSISG